MAEDRAALEHTLSLAAERRHDRLCDEFEDGWKAGSPARIEDMLAAVPPDERPALFTALFRIEIEYQLPKTINVAQYRARFPEWEELVDTLLRDPTAKTGDFADRSRQEFVPPPLVGYEIFEQLGEGGMGVVYRAHHLELDRPVAVKWIKIGGWTQPGELRRFKLEAESVAGLNHPNVVQLYAFGQVDRLPYFVMEYVANGSLASILNGKPADPDWAAELMATLARAVQYVHDKGLVHRDLKPANILLAADGVPKIADFGLAKRLTGDDPQLTHTRTILGTACYMAPEQAAGRSKEAQPAADVYALGAILFECLTGRPPFRAATYELTVAQVLTQDPPRPTDLVAALPADLVAICMKCLEKEPSRRYATAQALAQDLSHYREGLPVSALPLRMFDQDVRWAGKIDYEIIELISCSRWSVAYTARRIGNSRKVLLKRGITGSGLQSHQDMQREVDAVASLDHPNVVRLIDWGRRFDQTYLVTEFVEGGATLSRCLRDAVEPSTEDVAASNEFRTDVPATPFDPPRAAAIALRITLGLQAVHDNDYLHCALNSSDIILTRNDVPKIGNFTAAHRLGERGTAAPEWVAPNYLSPEMVSGPGAVLSRATDIYGIGAVLYDMLVGKPPFADEDPARITERILRESPPPPSRFSRHIPPALDTICLKCLAKNPEDRYPSAGSLALDLQQFLSRAGTKSADDTLPIEERVAVADSANAFQLRIDHGPRGLATTFELAQSRILIGRGSTCQLILEDETKRVSRLHCGVLWNAEARRYEVIDFGARNGTRVNGERLQGMKPLVPGDQIQIAGYILVFEICPERVPRT